MPALLPKVLPLHQVIKVDAFITGCPPDPERIWHAIIALAQHQLPEFSPEMRQFG
jgi:NAD-reducing hydrogenase small subunit